MDLLERFTAGDLDAFEALFCQHQRQVYAWMVRIVTNAALDHLRKSRREIELPADLPADRCPDTAVQHETRDRIRQAFAQLPPKYRLVATLALIEDQPYERIASAAGISVSLVKIRVFRAVRMLRKQLSSLGIKDAKS